MQSRVQAYWMRCLWHSSGGYSFLPPISKGEKSYRSWAPLSTLDTYMVHMLLFFILVSQLGTTVNSPVCISWALYGGTTQHPFFGLEDWMNTYNNCSNFMGRKKLCIITHIVKFAKGSGVKGRYTTTLKIQTTHIAKTFRACMSLSRSRMGAEYLTNLKT